MSRWPDQKAHVPWKRGRWQSFSRFFHSPCFLSEVANALAFYHAQTLVFPGFLCELMSYVNLPENKSIRKNKTLFFARLMNLKSCLMSVRGKQRNVQDYVARRHGSRSEVGSPPWQGGYRNKSYPLLHQQGIHSLDFFSWKYSLSYKPGKTVILFLYYHCKKL